MPQQLHACPTMMPTTPVIPEERLISNDERMQEDAHLARLFGGATLPLALLTQRAGTATADAGCIHDAQASIGFSASFLNTKRLASWTAQRPIRLERKV